MYSYLGTGPTPSAFLRWIFAIFFVIVGSAGKVAGCSPG
jgi:hypothetical protein